MAKKGYRKRTAAARAAALRAQARMQRATGDTAGRSAAKYLYKKAAQLSPRPKTSAASKTSRIARLRNEINSAWDYGSGPWKKRAAAARKKIAALKTSKPKTSAASKPLRTKVKPAANAFKPKKNTVGIRKAVNRSEAAKKGWITRRRSGKSKRRTTKKR